MIVDIVAPKCACKEASSTLCATAATAALPTLPAPAHFNHVLPLQSHRRHHAGCPAAVRRPDASTTKPQAEAMQHRQVVAEHPAPQAPAKPLDDVAEPGAKAGAAHEAARPLKSLHVHRE